MAHAATNTRTQHESGTRADGIELSSPAFANGETMPRRFTADGENVSPPLAWGAPPPTTKSFALILEDPDSTKKPPFQHWIAWNIPVDQRLLHEGVLVAEDSGDLRQGRNDFGVTGYGGPKPPHGSPAHRYVLRLLALDVLPDLPTGSSRAALDRAIEGHVVAEGMLVTPYARAD
jgi:Raf kinase inhibitor-like YbhB/YbcL family protein